MKLIYGLHSVLCLRDRDQTEMLTSHRASFRVS